MSVTRFSDVIVPGGIPSSNTNNAPLVVKAPASPPSQNELLRNALAIDERLAAERGER